MMRYTVLHLIYYINNNIYFKDYLEIVLFVTIYYDVFMTYVTHGKKKK